MKIIDLEKYNAQNFLNCGTKKIFFPDGNPIYFEVCDDPVCFSDPYKENILLIFCLSNAQKIYIEFKNKEDREIFIKSEFPELNFS
jgi:hypothetical protein